MVWVEIEKLESSPWQPRDSFDEAKLRELAESIRRSGLIQPVVVRASERPGWHELVAGERRVRAAMIAGLTRVPAVVRALDDASAAEWALTENIQREDLNPVERARAMRGLADEFGLTQAEVAERVGLERSTVANHFRLLDLGEEVLDLIASGKLGMGHGRALAGVSREATRGELARRAAREGWSVRRLERAIAQPTSGDRARVEEPTAREAAVVEWGRRLSERLGTRVRVRANKSGQKGTVVVEFFSLEHFEDLMRRLGGQ